jgi:hypothetical protein
MSANFDEVYSDLLARHGGDALGAADRAVIRRLSAVLASDEHGAADASQIAALTALLPPTSPAAVCDLTRLTDKQLDTLAEIMAVASGESPPSAEAAAAVVERSPRHWLALDLAAKLDEIGERALTEIERTQVAGLITGLLYPCCLPRALFAEAASGASSSASAASSIPAEIERAGGLAKPAPANAVRVEPDAPRVLTPAEAGCGVAPLQVEQPWRDQIGGQGGGFRRFDVPGAF